MLLPPKLTAATKPNLTFVRNLFQRFQLSEFVFRSYEIFRRQKKETKHLWLRALTCNLARTFVADIQMPLRKLHINVPKFSHNFQMYYLRVICKMCAWRLVLSCLCILIVCSGYLHTASWHSSVTLTEVFPCFFFFSFKANARVQPAKTGHGPRSSKLFVLFYILCVLCRSVYCSCVNVSCTTATGCHPNCS